jgi:hypothetical protein
MQYAKTILLMGFLKKSIDVQVSFAHAAGEICTLEGVVRYEAGDAILVGVAGEQWPVERSRFEQTYAPVPPLEMGQCGIYSKKYLPVEAQQLVSDRRIELQGGRGVLAGSAGDWLITDQEGRQWVVQKDIFEHSYTALDNSNRA